MIDPLELINTEFEIEINPCMPSQEFNCATPDEVLEFMFTPSNYL